MLHIDFETASAVNLARTGVHRYAVDGTTQIICMAWKLEQGPVQIWTPGQPLPAEVRDHVAAGGLVAAWNIAFDAVIWNMLGVHVHGFPVLANDQLRCVMAAALYWGLPAKLADVTEALGLPDAKDKVGHNLMLRMCKPRAALPDGTLRWWHVEDAAKAALLYAYCKQDVLVEAQVAAKINPLPAEEQAAWLLDYKANARGVRLDRQLIEQLKRVAGEARFLLQQEVVRLTNGQVRSLTNVSALLAHLKTLGSPVEDTRRATLEARQLLAGPLEKALIRLRLDFARTSTAKLDRMLACMDDTDDCVRGMVQYYGAGRTGRWAGRLVQPQNFPRGSIKNVADAIAAVLAGVSARDIDSVWLCGALAVVASCLRGCFVPRPGHVLVVADLAQIEARIVAWLAGQSDILDVFARGEDVYVFTAAKIGSTDRQLGKVVVLACGFGMGWQKFQATALTYGLVLDDAFAQRIVRTWREANRDIVTFWYDCDRAAKEIASGKHGDVRRVRGLVFERRRNTMLVRLPSGRQLVYRGIGIVRDAEGRDGIAYDGVDQRTRKWTRIRTYGGKLVENFTQAAARDVMRDAMAECARAGLPALLTIHDEILSEAPAAEAAPALDRLLRILRSAPAWAPNLPVGAEGYHATRYRK